MMLKRSVKHPYLITIMQQKQGKELHYIMEMVLFVDKPRKTFYFWG